MILMALCLIAPASYAELSKKELKQVQSESKKRAKQLEKDGYAIMGTTTLETALIKHNTLVAEGATPQMGYGRSKSKNTGRQMCLSSAMNEYVSREMSQIKGRTVNDAFGNEVDTANDEEFARFYSAFERLSQGEIQGELQESFTVIKTLPDGSYDFQMYLTVDEDRASKARMRAMRNAAVESGLSEGYAKQLSDFINQGFK